MLEISTKAALAGIAAGTVSHGAEKRPRIACFVSYWVFEQSKRSVPIFNDKHLSTSWEEAKWMFDKSRELKFPLFGGSSIPFYYRSPR